MLEALALQGKVRNRVTAVSHPGLEVVFSVEFVEPDCKVGVAHSGTPEGVELGHLDLAGQEVGHGVGGDGGSETVVGNTG